MPQDEHSMGGNLHRNHVEGTTRKSDILHPLEEEASGSSRKQGRSGMGCKCPSVWDEFQRGSRGWLASLPCQPPPLHLSGKSVF